MEPGANQRRWLAHQEFHSEVSKYRQFNKKSEYARSTKNWKRR
jgi:hypothetical protein